MANAGITWRARLDELDPADLARVHEVNVTGTLLGIQALTPLMTGGGSVVVVGSVAALTGHFPVAYTASKWALRGLAKAACLELGPRGIRVNTVHPGYIETPMTASAAPAFRAANVAETPLGRTGTVDEVAPLVLFLDQRRVVVHHRRGDPGRRRHDRPRRREVDQRRRPGGVVSAAGRLLRLDREHRAVGPCSRIACALLPISSLPTGRTAAQADDDQRRVLLPRQPR